MIAAWMPIEPVIKLAALRVGQVAKLLIVVSPWLDGAKEAVRYGKTLYVSPAMWKLLIYADSQDGGKEMAKLLAAIPVTVIRGVKAAWEEPEWVIEQAGPPDEEDYEP